jgi:Domain of unknown function (DUF4157)
VEENFMGHQHLSQTKNTIASPQSQTNAIARSSTHPIEELQGAIGNRAVNQLLAKQPLVQAKPMFGGLSRELVIQPKLTIGKAGDKYEQEADRVASQINRINPPASQIIQSKEMPEKDDEGLMKKPMIQRLADSGASGIAATPSLESSINQARGGGQLLAENIRQPMERSFGADFSGVKVHTDTQSDRLNQSIKAKAFTTGKDIFFRHGEYNPESRGGKELLAHELTHIVQQNNSAFQQIQRQLYSPVFDGSDVEIRLNGSWQIATVISSEPIYEKLGTYIEYTVEDVNGGEHKFLNTSPHIRAIGNQVSSAG